MATQDIKKLNSGKNQMEEVRHYDFSVMKPFVKFGIGAMGVLAHALIGIVRNIPKPHQEEPKRSDKIIKI